jgi:hypothetical protein
MAEVDDWAPVAPKKAADDDWAPVGGAEPNVAITSGEKQFEEDKRIVEQAAGLAPGELKAATYSALKSFLLGAPTHVAAAYTAYKENKPYEEAFKEQQRYEQALERQYPTSSTVGTGLGIGAGLLVPMGAVGQAGRALKAGTAARLAETSAPQIVKSAAPAAAELLPSAGVAGAMTGVQSALERPVTDIDVGGALKDAAIGAGIGAGAQAALPALGRYFSKFSDPVDAATGKLKPEAEAAVQRAFGNRMSADDIETFKDQLIDKFKSKGVSEQAAREALLEKEGVTPTRTMVTGQRPKAAAADIAEKAGVEAEDVLGQKLKTMAGTPPASETAAAEAVHGAYRGDIGEYKTLRESISQRPGTFDSDTFDLFLPSIEKRLKTEKVPTSFESTGDLFPKAAQAKKFIEEGIAAGNLPNSNMPFNMDNLELVRRGLVQYAKDARSPTDRRAIGFMIDGFDDALNKAVTKNLFTGNGRQLIDDMKQSRELWSDIQKKYFDNTGKGGQAFKKLMNELVDRKSSSIPADLTQGSAEAANLVINTGLLNPQFGTAMYERMEKALGKDSAAMQTVKDQIRNMVLNTNGDMKKLHVSIDKFLSDNASIAGKVFDQPNELSDLRRLSESIRLISTSRLPNEQKESKIIGAIQRLGTMVSAIAAWNFHSPVAGALTYLGGEGGRAAIGAGREMLQRAAERGAAEKTSRKAPELLRRLETAPEMNVPVRNVEPLLEPSKEEFQYQEPTPLGGRPGRKAGGRVGSLSDKLVTAVDRAKKNINNDTKVLLNADDNHVAKALEVANRHLEG